VRKAAPAIQQKPSTIRFRFYRADNSRQHKIFSKNRECCTKHEESAEEKKNISAGHVVILEFHDRNGELYDSATHQPCGEQGQAAQPHFTCKYSTKTETCNCQGTESCRAGGYKGVFFRHGILLVKKDCYRKRQGSCRQHDRSSAGDMP